ncbi:hypothetical protein CGMCC3_g2551 [Colletotrichum fructicola]|nr:uncharacterized protein CGMCC3_g2551 [Colletotrichum fructicola]KAE9581476.1 hypothetical protein CGMCC3_g2551 [Colletotrichum fructicola]
MIPVVLAALTLKPREPPEGHRPASNDSAGYRRPEASIGA